MSLYIYLYLFMSLKNKLSPDFF